MAGPATAISALVAALLVAGCAAVPDPPQAPEGLRKTQVQRLAWNTAQDLQQLNVTFEGARAVDIILYVNSTGAGAYWLTPEASAEVTLFTRGGVRCSLDVVVGPDAAETLCKEVQLFHDPGLGARIVLHGMGSNVHADVRLLLIY